MTSGPPRRADFAKAHFKNPAWGYSHCERDYALARELAAADHVTVDDDVLFAAPVSSRAGDSVASPRRAPHRGPRGRRS